MDEKALKYEDFVRLVIDAIEAAGIEYLIGGAVATWAWGEPRSTLDLDMVVNIPIEGIEVLSQELKKRDMLVPPDIILDNILETRADLPINAIHMYSGFKADLYPVRAGDELRSSAFTRRQKIDMGDPLGEIYAHSPEDLIIYKVWYYSISFQTKHVRDVISIIHALQEQLDYAYIDFWVKRKNISDYWAEILARTV